MAAASVQENDRATRSSWTRAWRRTEAGRCRRGLAEACPFLRGIAPTVGNRRINLRDAGEIERAVAAFAHSAKGGLILTSSVGDQTPRVSTVGE